MFQVIGRYRIARRLHAASQYLDSGGRLGSMASAGLRGLHRRSGHRRRRSWYGCDLPAICARDGSSTASTSDRFATATHACRGPSESRSAQRFTNRHDRTFHRSTSTTHRFRPPVCPAWASAADLSVHQAPPMSVTIACGARFDRQPHRSLVERTLLEAARNFVFTAVVMPASVTASAVSSPASRPFSLARACSSRVAAVASFASPCL